MPAALVHPTDDRRKHEIVYTALRDAILQGMLRVGTQVPSTRAMASRWAVSRGTLEAVYERLCAEGYLIRRQGAGTFVSAELPESFLHVQSGLAVIPPPAVAQPQHHESQVRAGQPFVARLPDPALFSLQNWARHLLRTSNKAGEISAESNQVTGFLPLKQEIAQYLREHRNIVCEPHQVIITTGIRHALALISRAFLRPDDIVAMEDPGYPFGRDIFALADAKLANIAVTEQGIDLEALSRMQNVRALYVTPSHQSPLGCVMSITKRLAIIDWAQQQGALIIEDDYDSEFSYSGSPLPALMSHDKSAQTLYCGSFNKTLSSELRVGFLVARGAQLARLNEVAAIHGRVVALHEQLALAEFMRSGAFARHLRTARQAYAERRNRLLAILTQHANGKFRVSGHEAGLHLLLWLPSERDEAAFCQQAAEHGLQLQPLSLFCRSIKLPPAVILGYAALTLAQIEVSARRLATLLV
jgi:GntR family transcriptional regulator/MocR family aminotransferase